MITLNHSHQINYRNNQIAFRSKETMTAKLTTTFINVTEQIAREGKCVNDNESAIILPVILGAVAGAAKVVSAVVKIPLKGLQILPNEVRELKKLTEALSDYSGTMLRAKGHPERAKAFTEVDLLGPLKKY